LGDTQRNRIKHPNDGVSLKKKTNQAEIEWNETTKRKKLIKNIKIKPGVE